MGRRRILSAGLLALFVAALVAPGNAATGSRGSELRALVQSCLSPTASGDGANCPAPGSDGDVADAARCRATVQVWKRSEEFVAIRDLKMCGCPSWFQHGLAMPFALLSGVESDGLPEGIWQFAWDAGRGRIRDPEAIALAVNSRLQRSQDQLHVHIVELLDDARARLPQGSTIVVDNLEHVWAEAQLLARAKNVADYGVLVVHGPGSKFTVVVADGAWAHSPEKEYTRFRCQ